MRREREFGQMRNRRTMKIERFSEKRSVHSLIFIKKKEQRKHE